MIGDPPPEPAASAPAPSRRGGGTLWVIAVLAFALGIAAVAYLWPMIDWRRAPAQPAMTTTQSAGQPVVAIASPLTLEALASREALLDAQLRAVEARMATTDAASRTASGYARRAEGLMIAFAARRALERGLQLGYIEGQLRDRFGGDQPQAVATVIAAARAPLTLADLREGLSQIAPALTHGSAQDGFFTSVWQELSNLVILRRDTNPSPRPDDRLARARIILDGGNVEAALAEVARMPGARDATSWIDAAKRYIESRRAVDVLERAAIDTRSGPAPAPAAAAVNPAGQLPGP